MQSRCPIAILVLATSISAQSTWIKRSPASSPPGRHWHAMAYDASRDRAVLFGGLDSTRKFADTWEWDGSNWKQLTPLGSPTARFGHVMVYFVPRNRVVLFGGWDQTTTFTDTWEWDGSNWTKLAPKTNPGNTQGGSPFAYDAVRKRAVMFGGERDKVYHAETWEWDGTNWSKPTPTTSPPQRLHAGLAYDEARNRTILFGGWSGSYKLSDTWEWDGKNWTKRNPPTVPPARGRHAMVYDPARRRVVMFGGNGSRNLLDDTWEWDGINWFKQSSPTSPSPRSDHALTYDTQRNRTVLFGGNRLSDTWEYLDSASYTTFGTGCGTASPPTLKAPTPPRIGQPFNLEVGNLKPRTGGVIVVGDSDTIWNGVPLPLDLTFMAMPGCKLLTSWISEVGIFTQNGGTVVWKVTIPNAVGLLGLGFFNQAWVLDPAANVPGIATSNGGKGVIGN